MGATQTTPIDVARTAEDLVAKCRMAKARGIEMVFAAKDVMDFYMAGDLDPKPYFTMYGLTVVEEGKLEEAERDFNKTIEQVNFGP